MFQNPHQNNSKNVMGFGRRKVLKRFRVTSRLRFNRVCESKVNIFEKSDLRKSWSLGERQLPSPRT